MSGLSRTPGKRVWVYPHRGFESRLLRQKSNGTVQWMGPPAHPPSLKLQTTSPATRFEVAANELQLLCVGIAFPSRSVRIVSQHVVFNGLT